MRIRNLAPVIVIGAALPAACGDDPFTLNWVANPDTVELYVISRPETNLLSAFDFHNRVAKRLEAPATGDRWDLTVDYRDGRFSWLPAGVLGIDSDAAVAILEGQTFEAADEAPADTTLYIGDEPIPIRLGPVYVIRTRLQQGAFSLCNYYGKIEVLETDSIIGTVRFQFDVNRICNSRDLVPPD